MYGDLALCIVWYIFRILPIIVNSDIFTSYSDIFSHIVAYLKFCVTLAYSEPCHIQKPGIFRTQVIFRTLSRHILAYSEHCIILTHWEPCHIQNFGICSTWAYSESCLFSHIQAYSTIFNNDKYSNINFLFFILILHTFQWNLKRHVFWLQWRQFQCSSESN